MEASAQQQKSELQASQRSNRSKNSQTSKPSVGQKNQTSTRDQEINEDRNGQTTSEIDSCGQHNLKLEFYCQNEGDVICD